MAGFDVEAGEPAAATDIGVDVDGVSKVQWKMGCLLSGMSADHDFS